MATSEIDELLSVVIEIGILVQGDIGPDLLESAYEAVLCHRLAQRGIKTAR